MDQLALWLKATWVSQQMITQPWLWPVCETLHFIGLALLVGTAGVFDLRMLGFLRRLSMPAAMQMRVWAGIGLFINLVTGVLFVAAAPEQYLENVAFYAKLAFLAIAVLNIAVFETTQGRRLLTVGAGDDTPFTFKVAGTVSIVSWLMVLYFGRMLPFVGNAF
jgi:hypothetical protein